MTVLESIQRSAEFLARKGVDSPRLQVELLLADVLRLPRLQLYLNFNRELTAEETESLRALVMRRGQREPLQHILGTTSFCGLELAVNRHALVPRPETEQLAELGWEFLKARSDAGQSPAALDFGTGTGCLAITLAVKSPATRLTAIDCSPEALTLARENAARHDVANRITFVEGDGFAALPADSSFDLVISNPPYILSGDIAGLDPEVRDHDPRVALDGGPDGLNFYRRLAMEGRERLREDGRLMAEFGDGQADALRELFAGQKWIVEAVQGDYSGRPRFLIASRGTRTEG